MNEFFLKEDEETQIHKFKHDTADFFLIFEDSKKRIPVNRAILLTSPYFENILKPREGFLQSTTNNELIITKGREDIIRIIIAYMYGCTIDITRLSFEQKLLLFETADLYLYQDLVKSCNLLESIRKSVEFNISYDNILKFTEAAVNHKLDNLYDKCLQFVANNIKELMSSDGFLKDLKKDQLIYLFQEIGDHLYIDKIDVPKFIDNWTAIHGEILEDEYKDIYLRCVRLELFTPDEFNNYQILSRIFTDADHENALKVNYPKRRRKNREPDIDFSLFTGAQIDGGFNTNRLLKSASNIELQRQTQYTHKRRRHFR